MDKILELAKSFEARNNISVYFEIHTDGSFQVKEMWEEDKLGEGNSLPELESFLRNVNYELDEKGKCYSPVRIKK